MHILSGTAVFTGSRPVRAIAGRGRHCFVTELNLNREEGSRQGIPPTSADSSRRPRRGTAHPHQSLLIEELTGSRWATERHASVRDPLGTPGIKTSATPRMIHSISADRAEMVQNASESPQFRQDPPFFPRLRRFLEQLAVKPPFPPETQTLFGPRSLEHPGR